MDVVQLSLLGGVTVIAGRWSQNKKLDVTSMAAVGFVIIFLSILAHGSPELSQAFGWLFFLGALFVYAPDILKHFGKAK